MPSLGARLQHAWNAFIGRDPTKISPSFDLGFSSYYRPDRTILTRGHERSIITTVYNRIAVDVASVNIQHVKVDDNGVFREIIKDGLNECLTLDANIDQTGRGLIIDLVTSMFDEGCVAAVPVDTTFNPIISGSYDIKSMRIGRIVEWYPRHVKVRLYNDRTGRKEEITLPKSMTAIIENPFYSVMNEPNSTLQRLIRTLNKLDIMNDQASSGKLDLIIQLPYVIKTEEKRKQAETRRREIEAQLSGSKYGIAYADGTEKIVQLNRAIENNLWTQVKELTSMLYNQLGLSQSIFDGSADEKVLTNYYNRTIDPILSAIVEEMTRKFLTKKARTEGQAIRYYRDPFRLVPVNTIAEMADKFRRNEILTSNELRAEIGFKPSLEERANNLANPNLNQKELEQAGGYEYEDPDEEYGNY
ncbi:MAG: phage portal protein [Clostridiales bacterium]|nr:phage portal protein [Clostridiales bacterium]